MCLHTLADLHNRPQRSKEDAVMGIYINPENESKEEFLERESVEFRSTKFGLTLLYRDLPRGLLPVVLVHNTVFTAAAIAFDAQEYARLTERSDERKRVLYLIPRSSLPEDMLDTIDDLVVERAF